VPDILDDIISRRRSDYASLGPCFGVEIPAHRARPVVKFLAESGTILEIKRASPSKGDIAIDLDPVTLAAQYEKAGTKNVSVLTEPHFFKGSLADLLAVGEASNRLSFLRKDFILFEDEIEVSYRAGADAVLLIARILDTSLLLKLAAKCRSFGMTPFIEVREASDVEKLTAAAKAGLVVAGVNTRDLATFRIDPLVPAILRTSLPCKTVFESGASTAGACRFARQLGFDGILIGEAAAKNPEGAHALVSAFLAARPDWVGRFWRDIGTRSAARTPQRAARTPQSAIAAGKTCDGKSAAAAVGAKGEMPRLRPLVKICGLTNSADALLASDLGADLLGFIFAPSPRAASASVVRETAALLGQRAKASGPSGGSRPLLIGVLVDPDSQEGRLAMALVCEGVLDAVQYHGDSDEADLPKIDAAGGSYGIGRYAVVRLGSEADLDRIDSLMKNGEPRLLLDARVEGIAGGTGKTIPKTLLRRASEKCGLWLAGGLNPSNVRQYIDEFAPELIDASSGLESAPGKKDQALLKSFFREIAG
jgi:indole-3-glycerol phosphate synthase/phosphoribosylanthranilate isomerase